MKALQLVAQGQPLEAVDIEVDAPGPSDVIVRVEAAGICHSDVHYRSGPLGPAEFPVTLGHEVAGAIVAVGDAVAEERVGERVCLHYQTSCGSCHWCTAGHEQFCADGQMLGNSRHGGYAEFITVPSVNAVYLPDEVPMQHAAVMMCSSATALHALRQARVHTGDRVAIVGVGGLGLSAVQLAAALGAEEVFAIDRNADRLHLAEELGAIPVDANEDPLASVLDATGGGVDAAIELVGSGPTMSLTIDLLGPRGRAAIVGLSDATIELAPYGELVGREAEIVGVSDHLLAEIPDLLDLYVEGKLHLDKVVGLS
ncbi:MAG: alcohol dehydrogenase catalytic domain-containing protein, partial [Acidimicrobiia bacterium]|nr:alcohol dehydrogenase catalytic domain-containing protein [Acidimicrobiia bacterium]